MTLILKSIYTWYNIFIIKIMVPPHGKVLISRITPTINKSTEKIQVTQKEEIDIYNIATGAYSPLTWFCRENDFSSITEKMCLSNGILWSIPIILDISSEKAQYLQNKWTKNIELLNQKNKHIASINDIEIYPFDKETYCKSVFGTQDINHPGVQNISKKWDFLIGWDIEVLEWWRIHFDDVSDHDTLSPLELRNIFKKRWFWEIAAFQTRNVPHRGHEYIQKCALENVDGLLIHPVIGDKKSGDFQNKVILWSYQILAEKYYNPERVVISCLPWVMKYAGPKEAIIHAIIRQNFWCSHFIVGRDHAGVGDYYGTYDAQKIFDTIPLWSLQIKILKYENAAYCPQVKWVVTDKTSPSPNAERIFISGTKFRNMLIQGIRPPEEFIRSEIVDYLLSENNIFID